ncbi:metal-sulfur cluster biosynthetic enzyme [Ancylobacter vacuolatus]|uniref:Metal-sulfur cluster biosynthetic enzyme n=2 Tax=Ancylobacter vacuolatus TaxID=223389 RepID=A0ABU0DKA6_9HYPH|nr:iron-sulfur cluster assembly protein [Ancylobacter vacuolatus]MDQ0348748.1 metal-sulfur cluster biosynthetic enzyme [Ancylobacter vacuolatus]
MRRPASTQIGGDARIAAVWNQLAGVMDPELDESIVDLGFVEDIAIGADGRVDVAFRLPTYWCSPNFAFLMADDIGRAVRELPWAREVHPRLEDHMFSQEVNRGTHLGLSFAETFRDLEVSDTLESLRETFLRKAFQRRQEAVILGLRRAGWSDAALVTTDLATLDRAVITDPEGLRQKPRYREILLARGLAARPSDLAFVTLDGAAIPADGLALHLRGLRAIRINMEANGALCRGLLDARYDEGPRAAAAMPSGHACGSAGASIGCCGSCALHAGGAVPAARDAGTPLSL